jgi:ferredoxin
MAKYAASPCSCRLSRRILGENCADDPEDWCIGVGDMADYLVETHKGHYIDYDEVMNILRRAEDNGFVHQITNIDGENKIFAICNCNVSVCYALRTSQLFNTPNMSRSAYVAKVDPMNCVACGRCVEYCPAGAVRLGQKLCTKDGPCGLSAAGAAGRRQVGPGQVERGLSRQQPQKLLRHGNLSLQDGLSRAHRRAGLSQDGVPGPLSRRAGAHQKGESVPGRLRPYLQPPLRGCLYARHGRPGGRHRRGEKVPGRVGAPRGGPLSPRDCPAVAAGAVFRENRRDRRRARRPELRLLSGADGLQARRI